MSKPTLILITGYARAGKDCLAEGIMGGIGPSTAWAHKRNMADTLKESCNLFLESLNLDGFREHDGPPNDFFHESFKVRNRHFLVQAGTFARSIDRDVFAAAFARKCLSFAADGPGVVVCSDWRYLNELRFAQRWLETVNGWRIVTVRIDTSGNQPANEEEGMSIAEITREVAIDVSFTFAPDRSQLIKAEGRNLARQLGL
jgi:hypothetical protein